MLCEGPGENRLTQLGYLEEMSVLKSLEKAEMSLPVVRENTVAQDNLEDDGSLLISMAVMDGSGEIDGLMEWFLQSTRNPKNSKKLAPRIGCTVSATMNVHFNGDCTDSR